ncbi:MAG: nicotinate (nicotinamide) nucleotide adenylyltransferase [Chitinivibrionales bacterium]|nr:nicotinate (nicotinamide) nucleotide adenylyltransferase [Chitinivibrionales bacterium]
MVLPVSNGPRIMSESRLGLFGGSFDPVHNGHIAVASLAREFLGLSRVVFIPACIPPHKQRTVHAPAEHRLAMLERALAGKDEAFTIYRGELERRGPSYSIDTIEELLHDYPGAEICFIVGSDNLTEIPTWHRYRDIVARVNLCVAHRPGYSGNPPPELDGATITEMPSPEWGISSTMIRALIAQGYSCDGLLPWGVRGYVEEHGLYGARRH